MVTYTTLWLDLRDQFVEEHVEEWEAQKCQTGALNDLEGDTKVVYQACIIKRQEDKAITDSKEAATKELPPEQQVAHVERQAGATPMKQTRLPQVWEPPSTLTGLWGVRPSP